MDNYKTRSESCEILGIHYKTLYKLAENKEIETKYYKNINTITLFDRYNRNELYNTLNKLKNQNNL